MVDFGSKTGTSLQVLKVHKSLIVYEEIFRGYTSNILLSFLEPSIIRSSIKSTESRTKKVTTTPFHTFWVDSKPQESPKKIKVIGLLFILKVALPNCLFYPTHMNCLNKEHVHRNKCERCNRFD